MIWRSKVKYGHGDENDLVFIMPHHCLLTCLDIRFQCIMINFDSFLGFLEVFFF